MSHLRPPAPVRALQRELSIAAAGSADLRFDDLLPRAAEPEILRAALRVVTTRKGGDRAGPDGIKPSGIEQPQAFVTRLSQDLLNGRYRHGPCRQHEVPKADGSFRVVGIPSAVDRVADTAIAFVMRPVVDAGLPDCSFGFRLGRGTQQALEAAGQLVRASQLTDVLVRLDIEQCFTSITWSKLKSSLERRFIDPALLGFIHDLIADHGIPQGSPLAPALVDCHLTPLLNQLAADGRGVMFGDDILAACSGPDEAAQLMKRLTQTADELGLRFATAKTSITPVNQGASFLGYQLALHAGHLAVAADPRALPALDARLGDLASSVRGKDAGKLIHRVNRTLRGWGEYYRFDRDVLAQGYDVARGVVLAWLEKRFPRRIVRRYYVTSGSLGDGTAILLDPLGIYTDFPAAGLSNGRSAQPLSPQATGGTPTQGSSNPSAGAQEPRHRVVLRERCAETGVALSGDGATPIGDDMPAKRQPQLAGDEVPIQLPEDLLSMPPEAYADEFNRAVAFRARIAEELVGVQRGIAEIEHQKAVHAAQLRREAQMARLQLTKQQLKDELLLDPAFDALCRDELKLADQRRQLTAAHEAIDIHLKGWSRVVELRRQELVLNPPAVARRTLRNR